MSAQSNGIGTPGRNELCVEHSMLLCRLCNRVEKPKFGTVRKPIKRSQSKRQKMSADAKVQDVMLGKGRCWLCDYSHHTCTDGKSQRAHIIPQQTIRDLFPLGAYLTLGGWKPIEEWTPLDGKATRTLQEILDDTRNLVPVCPAGNVDGLEMVDALGELGYPPNFEDFKREYSWDFNGRYWFRSQRPVVFDPRAA